MYDTTTMVRNIDPEDLKDEENVLRYIQDSDICLGLLTKRGNASIKSMTKVYRFDSDYEQSMKTQSSSQSIHDDAAFDINSRLRCPGA